MKFLPERLSRDAAALSRFHAEVRNARQVSHPNVCRVFDIGEAEGTLFLTMEYVDGEDLASVVRRIGRLSPDKATEIARQICAGLAAAHERGVIHRDLKPANVMLDGAGKIRITDFGLAGLAAACQRHNAVTLRKELARREPSTADGVRAGQRIGSWRGTWGARRSGRRRRLARRGCDRSNGFAIETAVMIHERGSGIRIHRLATGRAELRRCRSFCATRWAKHERTRILALVRRTPRTRSG